MTKTYTYWITTLLLLALCGCSKQEVQVFSADRGVNFVLYDSLSREYTDNYEQLKYEHNFFQDYPTAGWNVPDITLSVGVYLEGTLSDQPVHVKIKAEPVEGYDMPQLGLPAECVIEAGDYRTHFNVVCKKPQTLEKVYKALLTFDYEASGLVAGTKERQQYAITLSDATAWADMFVANETEWNSYYANILGNYGPMKGRFILVACGTNENDAAYPFSGKDYKGICNYYYNTKMGWGGFSYSSTQGILTAGLDWYKEAHGKELTEADGTPVTFKFMQ